MNAQSPDDHALEQERRQILDTMLSQVPFDGWNQHVLDKAVTAAKGYASAMDRGDGAILFPKGVPDVLLFWSAQADQHMVECYRDKDPAPTRIRDKVTALVRARIEALSPHQEAARRAAAYLALPPYIGIGQQLSWHSVDLMWRLCGDTSTDFNFYSKRASLSAVYLSTLTRWMSDPHEDKMASWEFLDERIENVMQFEKVKAQVNDRVPDFPAMITQLARWRYPSG